MKSFNPLLIAASVLAMAVVVFMPVHAADTPRSDIARPDTAKIDAEKREQVEKRMQAAQERIERSSKEIDEASQEIAQLSMAMGQGTQINMVRIIHDGAGRPVLGLNIDMSAKGDGVRVVSVSPGGPAEAAGIKANDVVVSFDGKALKASAEQSAQRQLLAALETTKADEAKALEFRRDARVVKVQIVPKTMAESFAFAFPEVPEPPTPPAPNFMDAGDSIMMVTHRGGAFGSAELVELSPDLGRYFGTDKGLLVVRAPKEARFKLVDGDVLLDIDGRVPGSVAHAFQILSSYRGGETVRLHVMRQQKRVELAVQIPERSGKPAAMQMAPPAPPATGDAEGPV